MRRHLKLDRASEKREMFYTLMIHAREPEMAREAMPGDYVTVHAARQNVHEVHRPNGGVREWDLIATVGFDFDELPEALRQDLSRSLNLQGAIVRMG